MATNWIPVQERLPENTGDRDVLVTCSYKYGNYVMPMCYNDGWNCAASNDADARKYERHNVIAWLPLPDPYEEVLA